LIKRVTERFTDGRVPDPGIRVLFARPHRWQCWLDVEAALATAEAECGVIPAAAAAAIQSAARLADLDLGRIERGIAATSHALMALITELSMAAGEHGGWVHWGATTQNITQTGYVLVLGLDDRIRALGERMAASPQPWLARQLGVIAPDASPALREEYTRRAGLAAAYREAAGITNPEQAVSLQPHRGNPELENMRQATITALEIRDEAAILRGLDRGELEAQVLAGERAQAGAPPDESRALRLTAQAEADALQQSADAEVQHDQTGAASAKALAQQLAAERQRLEADNARYEMWSADTGDVREAAGRASAELQRRGHARLEEEPQPQANEEPRTIAGWWREFEADLQAVERALARQHQAAIDAGEPGPPQRAPELDAGPTPKASPEDEPAPEQPPQQNRTTRIDELLARAGQAAQRLAVQQAEQQASSEYAARIEREAQAEPEAGHQAEAGGQAEIEM
jgi:hypothetical protein